MATIIRLPAVLAGSEEGAIQTWLVTPGQTLSVGTPLAEVETEKATVEYASEIEGTVLKLLVEEGTSVNVGDPIAVVGAEGESAEDAAPPAPADVPEPSPVPAAPEPETAPEAGAPEPEVAAAAHAATAAPAAAASTSEPSSADHGARTFMSPIVRRLAAERGLDLSTVTGSGPGGRIVRRDIEGLSSAALSSAGQGAAAQGGAAQGGASGAGVKPADSAAAAAAPAAPAASGTSGAEGGYTDIPHSGMRRAIARRLVESKTTIPHFYLVADCRVDALLEFRQRVNETAAVKISVNDFVVKAAAAAFRAVPEANAIWTDTAIRRFDSVDIAVAVSVDGGLVTPVVRGVERMSLSGLSASIRDLAERGRAGKLKQHEIEGGSFSVSNLGMYGTQEFSAIINPPHAGILAVGAARKKPIVVDDELVVGNVMTVTLSADHRVLDGALAAQWLAAFVALIENPVAILV